MNLAREAYLAKLICTYKKRREKKKNIQKFQENTIPYRRQKLEEGKVIIMSHSFLPSPFLILFPFIKYSPLTIVKPVMTMRG